MSGDRPLPCPNRTMRHGTSPRTAPRSFGRRVRIGHDGGQTPAMARRAMACAYDRPVPRLTGVSPVLLVADLERSVAYYRDRLGFACQVHGHPPNFAAATRDDATILLALAPPGHPIVPHWHAGDGTWLVHIRL